MSEQQVSCHRMEMQAEPWHHEQVRLNGKPIGYLIYRRIDPIPGFKVTFGPWFQYLISDCNHRRMSDPWCSYLDHDVAVAALVSHASAKAGAA